MQKTEGVAENKTAYPPLQETAHPTNWAAAVAGDTPLFTPKSSNQPPFIKGPLPLAWIQRACRVNAAGLALFIWWKVGLLGAGAKVPLRPGELARFGLSKFSIRRQYKALVKAGLVRGELEQGKCKAVRVVPL